MFDTYQWAPDATVESGQHVIPYMYSSLTDVGVDVIPVVGYDRWGVEEYRLALNSIRDFHRGDYCIRFDSLALEDAAEPEFFKENVDEILDDLGLAPSRCRVVLDLGDVTSLSLDALFEKVDELFQQLIPYKFSSFSIVGCSLPKTIDGAVKKPDSCGNVIRKEMLLWRSLRQQYPKVPMSFGDYGVRGPNTNEGVRSPHTNGKIRYTIDKEYFIARGHSMSWPGKGEQMWHLAQTIIESPYYMGEEFSWGDEQIAECSRRKFKGAAAQWITIDTNHHIAYAVVEIEEFERQLAATQSRIREDL